MADQTLYEKEHGPDKIRVYLKEVNGGTDIWVDFSSPGKCDCVRSRSLSTSIELMLKITDEELWRIAPRDYDTAGHMQNVPPDEALVNQAVTRLSPCAPISPVQPFYRGP